MQKAQMDNQSKMQQIQMQAQIEQAKLQGQMQLEKAKQEYQAQENQLKFQLEDQRNQREAEMEIMLAKQKTETENNKQILIAYLDNATKIEAARISAGLDDGSEAYIENVEQAKIMQDNMGYSQMATHPLKPAMDNMHQSNQQLAQMLAMLLEKMHQPKEIVRDENGKIVGVR
jgi:ATP-dependent DNA ligase